MLINFETTAKSARSDTILLGLLYQSRCLSEQDGVVAMHPGIESIFSTESSFVDWCYLVSRTAVI